MPFPSDLEPFLAGARDGTLPSGAEWQMEIDYMVSQGYRQTSNDGYQPHDEHCDTHMFIAAFASNTIHAARPGSETWWTPMEHACFQAYGKALMGAAEDHYRQSWGWPCREDRKRTKEPEKLATLQDIEIRIETVVQPIIDEATEWHEQEYGAVKRDIPKTPRRKRGLNRPWTS